MGLISSSLKENVGAKFVPTDLQVNREDIFTYLDEDHPEIYSDGVLEVGKLVQDQLSLSIRPIPNMSKANVVGSSRWDLLRT
ncbi:MAG: hypothetical protein CM1200mP4_1630 [Rhodospirillaceae bacterium]|nr:MAG: hypothetical protein CM1200mP4_1630 [Rhodospirillaceae bacterium]